MVDALLGILEHGLSIWDTKEGRELYTEYRKAKKRRDVQLDKKAKGLKYSQLAIDTSMRVIDDIAEARLKYLTGK